MMKKFIPPIALLLATPAFAQSLPFVGERLFAMNCGQIEHTMSIKKMAQPPSQPTATVCHRWTIMANTKSICPTKTKANSLATTTFRTSKSIF